MLEIIDRAAGIAGGVLDGAADQTGFGRAPDGQGSVLGGVAIAILEIGTNRQVGGGDDRRGIGQGLVTRHRRFGIATAERES